MNRFCGVIFILLMAAWTQIVCAESTGEMKEYCQKPDGNIFRIHCHSYIGGIIDVQANYFLEGTNESIRTCFPAGITSRQGAAVFVKWTKENPQLLHIQAYLGVLHSLNEAFPCANN